VSVVVPMDYSSLLWATALGWAVFGTLPAAATFAGAPVIIASGLYIVWRESRGRVGETVTALSDPAAAGGAAAPAAPPGR
jgi:drug/metabolite transporter (DMT)-like permease